MLEATTAASARPSREWLRKVRMQIYVHIVTSCCVLLISDSRRSLEAQGVARRNSHTSNNLPRRFCFFFFPDVQSSPAWPSCACGRYQRVNPTTSRLG
mmetsp:Transcript_52402/g.78286  ORF Transcript_52402/g.78286 Transcript_52402/m.78286 type:complete len:98 (-) Transcript_52402:66-359(-)